MSGVLPGRYWDSVTFLGYLNGPQAEPTKYPLCNAVIDAAKAGQVRIVTSALTFAEVFWMKRQDMVPQDQWNQIAELFEYSWIVPVELDRPTAVVARQLIWDFKIKSWDAVHVASAIKARRFGAVECFDTFDGDLIALTGKLPNTDLVLSLPNVPAKLPLSGDAIQPSVAAPSSASAPPAEQSPDAEPLSNAQPEPDRPSDRPDAPEPQPPDSSPPAARRPPSDE